MENTNNAEDNLNYLKYYHQNLNNGDSKNLQVNIRMNTKLLSDIDFISDILHIDRSEWMRVQLSKAVQKELSEKTSSNFKSATERFIRGEIDENQYLRIVGLMPSKEVLDRKKKEIETKKKATKKTKEYLRGLANKKS
jgi:hypothetical protein